MDPTTLMQALQVCWCELLASTSDGAPATCCLVAGKPAIVDCCNGYAWVRLVQAYPTEFFPQPFNTAKKCPALTWALVVEVGVTRCAAGPCSPTDTTCCANEAAAADALFSDFEAARKLWSCGCIGLANDQIIPGQMRVYGPEGGCVGVTMTATLQASYA